MSKYKTGDVVDGDDVVLSEAAGLAWSATMRRAAALCHVYGIPEDKLPEEQVRWNADGSLTAFVEIRAPSGGTVVFDMTVPPEHWTWRT